MNTNDISWPQPHHIRACEMRPQLKKMQMIGRPQRHQEFRFTWTSKADPLIVSEVTVGAHDLMHAIESFFRRTNHPCFKADQMIPTYGDLQLNADGGWVVDGDDATILITVR